MCSDRVKNYNSTFLSLHSVLTPFCRELMDEEIMYGCLMHNTITSHTASF